MNRRSSYLSKTGVSEFSLSARARFLATGSADGAREPRFWSAGRQPLES